MTIFPVYGIKELETENGKESGSIVKGEGEGMEKNDFITDVNVTKKKFSKKNEISFDPCHNIYGYVCYSRDS